MSVSRGALGRRLDLSQSLHQQTKRDYLLRVTEHDKAFHAEIAQQWGFEYWDGERHQGYGGYHYDGRQAPLAQLIVDQYNLQAGMSVLDVGCGKGYLLFELSRIVPGLIVAGIDISTYGIEHAKEEVRTNLTVGGADELPYDDASFDLVLSFTTLHNLGIGKLWKALEEIERVGRGSKYVLVESYRNEREKVNLLYWQLTCRSFYSVEDWEWIYERAGYRGDYGFIFFE